MLDYNKLLDFYNEHDLSADELMLLYTLYIRNEQIDPSIYKQMSTYYNKNRDKGYRFVTMVRNLRDRGFLEILKESGEEDSIDLKYLKIDQKFVDLLFIRPDDIWSKFYARYPAKGVSPDGYDYFTANLLDKDDEQYFKKHILKNANKAEAEKILYYVEEMFDWNPYKQKPENYAKVGITKFLRNWNEIIRQWEEEETSGNWNSNRL